MELDGRSKWMLKSPRIISFLRRTRRLQFSRKARKLIENNRTSQLVSFIRRWSVQTEKVNLLWYSGSDLDEFKRFVCKWKWCRNGDGEPFSHHDRESTDPCSTRERLERVAWRGEVCTLSLITMGLHPRFRNIISTSSWRMNSTISVRISRGPTDWALNRQMVKSYWRSHTECKSSYLVGCDCGRKVDLCVLCAWLQSEYSCR